MTLFTHRLILRHFKETDAEDLYRYASDPEVGPIAGWPPHKSVEESREIIINVLSGDECYAVCLKENDRVIGTVELKLKTSLSEKPDECELGFCLSREFWGNGIIPEASERLIEHAFDDLGITRIWCGYFEGNIKSKRVQEKLGFVFNRIEEKYPVPLFNENRICYIGSITK